MDFHSFEIKETWIDMPPRSPVFDYNGTKYDTLVCKEISNQATDESQIVYSSDENETFNDILEGVSDKVASSIQLNSKYVTSSPKSNSNENIDFNVPLSTASSNEKLRSLTPKMNFTLALNDSGMEVETSLEVVNSEDEQGEGESEQQEEKEHGNAAKHPEKSLQIVNSKDDQCGDKIVVCANAVNNATCDTKREDESNQQGEKGHGNAAAKCQNKKPALFNTSTQSVMDLTLPLNDSGMEVVRSLEVVNSEDEQGEGESEQQEEKEHGNAAKYPEKSLQIVNSKDGQCDDEIAERGDAVKNVTDETKGKDESNQQEEKEYGNAVKYPEKSLQIVNSKDDQCDHKIVECVDAVNNVTDEAKGEDESNQQGENEHGNAAAKHRNKKPAFYNSSTQSVMDLTLPLNDSGMEVERSLEKVLSEDEQGECASEHQEEKEHGNAVKHPEKSLQIVNSKDDQCDDKIAERVDVVNNVTDETKGEEESNQLVEKGHGNAAKHPEKSLQIVNSKDDQCDDKIVVCANAVNNATCDTKREDESNQQGEKGHGNAAAKCQNKKPALFNTSTQSVMDLTLPLNDSGMEVERSLEVVNSEDEQGEGESEQQEEKEHGNAAKYPEKSLQIVNSKDDQCDHKIVECVDAVNNVTDEAKGEDESNQQGENEHGNAAAKHRNKKPAFYNSSTQSVMDLTLPLNVSGMEVERSLEKVLSEDEQGECASEHQEEKEHGNAVKHPEKSLQIVNSKDDQCDDKIAERVDVVNNVTDETKGEEESNQQVEKGHGNAAKHPEKSLQIVNSKDDQCDDKIVVCANAVNNATCDTKREDESNQQGEKGHGNAAAKCQNKKPALFNTSTQSVMDLTLPLNDSGMEVERSLEVVNSEDEQGEGESEQQEEKEHGNAAKHPEKSLQIVNSKDDQCEDKIVECVDAVNNATCDTKRKDESNQQGEKGHGNAAAKRQNKKPALFNTSTQSIMDLTLPLNDSGMEVERSLEIVDSEDEQGEGESNKKHPDKKPERPCVFCKIPQTRLKRHILTKHKDHKEVAPLLTLTSKEQDIIIAEFRRDGIRSHNMEILKSGDKSFIRERKSSYEDLPVMCAGCKGFFAKSYKARHQLVCPSNGTNFMIPAISIDSSCILESYSDNFKALLNTLQLDDVGSYIQTDGIILMVGARSFAGVRRKKDKQNEANKSVRGRMRLLTRVYLAFRDLYSKQTEIILQETKGDASDMFRREKITILGNAVVGMCEKSETNTMEESNSVTDLKSHFLVNDADKDSKRVVDFLEVFKLYEHDYFDDAYYELNNRRNSSLRKAVNLPRDEDVQKLVDKCHKIMNSIDIFDFNATSYVLVRSAVATSLIIFNARRGGEPVRLRLKQWEEALKGEWMDKVVEPEDVHNDTMLVTYQTGKGANHLVPVMFPPETIFAMKYLANQDVRRQAGVMDSNDFVFASTQKSSK